jgi:hypothetical protein
MIIVSGKRWIADLTFATGFTILRDTRELRVAAGTFILPLMRYSRGAVAQLGERLNGIQEVVGSIPIGSTIIHHLPRASAPF